MTIIQEAVRAYLEAESGVRAVSDRSAVREYPLLAVAVAEQGTVLIAGGRQAEHTYRVTVTVVSDRERSGNTALLAQLPLLLLRGVPMEMPAGSGDAAACEKRVLHPLDIRTEGEELTFDLVLCVPVPPVASGGEEASETMQRLHFDT